MTDTPVDDTPAAPGRDAQRTRRRRRRRVALVGVAAFVAVAAGVVVLPARTWVSQQMELRSSKAQLERLRSSNAALSHKIDKLGSDGSIERQAREQFGLVYPGEEPYTVLAVAAAVGQPAPRLAVRPAPGPAATRRGATAGRRGQRHRQLSGPTTASFPR